MQPVPVTESGNERWEGGMKIATGQSVSNPRRDKGRTWITHFPGNEFCDSPLFLSRIPGLKRLVRYPLFHRLASPGNPLRASAKEDVPASPTAQHNALAQ